MYKTVRSLSLALLFTLASVPAMKADRWGTNPVPMTPGVADTMGDALMFNLEMI